MADCTGDGVLADAAGRIYLDRCGPNPASTWSWACPISTGNALQLTEDGCLWTPPRAIYNVVRGTGTSSSPGTASATAVNVTNVCTLSVANLDPCRTANALVAIRMQWTGTPSTNGRYVMTRKITGVSSSDTAFNSIHSDESPVSASRRHVGEVTRLVTNIPAAGSVSVVVGMGAICNAGTFVVTSFEAIIQAIVVPSTS